MTKNIVLVQATFHEKAIGEMLSVAKKTASDCGLKISKVVSVPGCMEIPYALNKNLLLEKFAGAVVIGIIERGETAHGLVMAQSVISSIIDLQTKFDKPVGVGILGPEINPSQIQPRLAPYAEAAMKAVNQMLKLK